MIAAGIAAALAATVLCLGIFLGLLRWKAYRRKVCYDPRQDFCLGVAGPATQTIPLDSDGGDILLPASLNGVVSGFIELEVHSSALGNLFDPTIEIRSGTFSDVQYLERGARGTRFLNVSRLLNSRGHGERIHLRGRRTTWSSAGMRLHTCKEAVAPHDRALVIAPHPDDAEIAAHGLYAKLRATVVTLTAGDASDRYQGSNHASMKLSHDAVARLRVWDSVIIPQYCGLPPEQVVNLCFPDGALRDMFRHPDRDFQFDNEAPEASVFSDLRRINRSSLIAPESSCSWRSLVRELGRIVAEVKPTIVVCPHPTLDPHPDHLFATVALCEALKGTDAATERMFLYAVHNRRTELWPFGPAGSGVALLPIGADDGVCASGFYSHALSTEEQEQKFLALEAMHDIRQIQMPAAPSIGQLATEMMAELRGWAHGLGRTPKSYLRRSVRPDELFFVTSLKEGMSLTDRALDEALRCSTA